MPRGRRRFRPVELILFVIIAVIVGHIVTHIFFTPWLLIAILAFLWLRYRPHHYRRP
jgi:predicted membrane protein